MVLRAFLFLIGERKVPLFIRFIVEIPLLVTVYSHFTGATLWGTVLLWQANRRGAGGERKAPCKRHYTTALPEAVSCQEA